MKKDPKDPKELRKQLEEDFDKLGIFPVVQHPDYSNGDPAYDIDDIIEYIEYIKNKKSKS